MFDNFGNMFKHTFELVNGSDGVGCSSRQTKGVNQFGALIIDLCGVINSSRLGKFSTWMCAHREFLLSQLIEKKTSEFAPPRVNQDKIFGQIYSKQIKASDANSHDSKVSSIGA